MPIRLCPHGTKRRSKNKKLFARGAAPLPSAALARSVGEKAQLEVTFGRMSEGTRKKFALSAALLGEPAVIIMDEPGNALDADSLTFLIEKLKQAASESAVVIATHDRQLIESTNAAIIAPHPVT